MFTFKSNTNLSPLTGMDLPLTSLQHFLEAGSVSRPNETHWCELGAKLGTEQVVHTVTQAEVTSSLPWCGGGRLAWHKRAGQPAESGMKLFLIIQTPSEIETHRSTPVSRGSTSGFSTQPGLTLAYPHAC